MPRMGNLRKIRGQSSPLFPLTTRFHTSFASLKFNHRRTNDVACQFFVFHERRVTTDDVMTRMKPGGTDFFLPIREIREIRG